MAKRKNNTQLNKNRLTEYVIISILEKKLTGNKNQESQCTKIRWAPKFLFRKTVFLTLIVGEKATSKHWNTVRRCSLQPRFLRYPLKQKIVSQKLRPTVQYSVKRVSPLDLRIKIFI